MSSIKERMCNHVINDVSLNTLARRLAAADRLDLIQELALIICEKDDNELSKIEGYFNFWCVRVMINMTGNTGGFAKKYRPKQIQPDDARFDFELEYDHSLDETLSKVDSILSGLYWYKRELFKLYVQCGSFRKVQKEVGINYLSTYHTVKEVITEIKEKI